MEKKLKNFDNENKDVDIDIKVVENTKDKSSTKIDGKSL